MSERLSEARERVIREKLEWSMAYLPSEMREVLAEIDALREENKKLWEREKEAGQIIGGCIDRGEYFAGTPEYDAMSKWLGYLPKAPGPSKRAL